jgi:hypothetical protein
VLRRSPPRQLLSSLTPFLGCDSVGGSGPAVSAGTWLVTGAITLTSPGSTSCTVGLLVFFIAAIDVPTVAASLGKILDAAVMFSATARFAPTVMYELVGGTVDNDFEYPAR